MSTLQVTPARSRASPFRSDADLPRAASPQRVTTLKNSLGMLGTLVALHERLGDVEAAAKAVANAVDGAADDETLRAAAGFFSRHGRWEQAAAAQQALLDHNERDLQARAISPHDLPPSCPRSARDLSLPLPPMISSMISADLTARVHGRRWRGSW